MPPNRWMSDQTIDWEGLERDYRAGVLSLRELATLHGGTEGAIRKRAKRDGWTRDLAAKVLAKAEELVRRDAVRNEVRSTQNPATERETIEANAAGVAEVRLRHRSAARRTQAQVERLVSYLEGVVILEDNAKEFGTVLKQAADAQKTLVGIEREAWGMASAQDVQPAEAAPIDELEGARRLAFALSRAADTLESRVH